MRFLNQKKRKGMKTLKLISGITLVFILMNAQFSYSQSKPYKITLADSMEVMAIGTLITSVYDLLSGPAGERNWIKLRFLCLPNASFVSIKRKPDGSTEYFQGTIDDYIKKINPVLIASDYYENEVERSVQASDNIANVFSTFESSLFTSNGVVNQRGTNSFQLIYKDDRWWIANIIWKNEPNEMIAPPKR